MLQPCLLEGTSVPIVVWCPVLCECSINFVVAIVRTLTACPAPPSCRHGLFATRSRLSRKRFLGISGLRPITSCIGERPESDNRLFLQGVEAWSPLILRLVVEHQPGRLPVKQLGMMFHFALLFLRFPSGVRNFHARRSHQFMNSSLICARCGWTVSQVGRMHGLNQASVGSLFYF